MYGNDKIEFDYAVELSGYLLKRSDQLNKWQNKFVILKDNFLLWYKDDDFMKMKKSKYFNMKPQGIIFLNDCIIREFSDSNQPYCFILEHSAFQKPQVFATDSIIARETWIQQLSFNSNLNYQNMVETQRFINELMDTSTSVKYAKVKQECDEAKDENENLLKVKKGLEEENEENKNTIQELQAEFNKMKEELNETYSVLNNVQSSRQYLEQQNTELESDYKRLEEDYIKTSKLLEDDSGKNDAIEELKNKLDAIIQQKEHIDHEKKEVQKKLSEKEDIFCKLQQENKKVVNQAQELNNCINNLKHFNLDMEKKLKSETAARIEAERRLREAERSVGRLHTNIVDGGNKYTTEKKDEMKTDVNKLKDYFENIITAQKSPTSPEATSNSMEGSSRTRLVSRSGFSIKRQCRDQSINEEDGTKPTMDHLRIKKNAILMYSPNSYTAQETVRVREKSQKIREEHRQRISLINLTD